MLIEVLPVKTSGLSPFFTAANVDTFHLDGSEKNAKERRG